VTELVTEHVKAEIKTHLFGDKHHLALLLLFMSFKHLLQVSGLAYLGYLLKLTNVQATKCVAGALVVILTCYGAL